MRAILPVYIIYFGFFGHLDGAHAVWSAYRFQRSVLRKGQLLKRGKAGALFGDRYAVSERQERNGFSCWAPPGCVRKTQLSDGLKKLQLSTAIV